jgi:transcriptional regulator with XRE-family HTH domain
MQTPSLGDKIKELRAGLKISLRELSRRAEISAPHLSDIELGRRYPSKDALERLSKELKVEVSLLSQLDTRDSLGDLKRMMTKDPAWGVAFRQMAEDGKQGKLTPEDVRLFLASFNNQA